MIWVVTSAKMLLKLYREVLLFSIGAVYGLQECSYISKIITRYFRCFIHIDCIVIIILGVFIFMPVVLFIQNQFFVTNCIINICKPSDAFYTNIFYTVFVNSVS